MLELKTSLALVVIHLIYYSILQVFSDIVRMGSVKNTPNKLISKLRTDYHVNIRTFKKNTNHFGFAWFNTIYLNESLFKRDKALMNVFFHELYHVQHNHKRNTLLFRFIFSLIPIFFSISLWFLLIYVGSAYALYLINEQYEKQATDYANQMTKDA